VSYNDDCKRKFSNARLAFVIHIESTKLNIREEEKMGKYASVKKKE